MADKIKRNGFSIMLALFCGLFVAMAGLMEVSAINVTGNTTVDGTIRDVFIYDLTETAPFIIANSTVLHRFAFLLADGNVVEDIDAVFNINSTDYNLTFNPNEKTYNIQLYYNMSDIGDLPFIVSGTRDFYDIHPYSGIYFVRDFILIGFDLWKDKNETSRLDEKDMHLFLIPHNKSSAIKRIPELAMPFVYMDSWFKTKFNRWLYLNNQQRISSINEGFHNKLNVKGTTYLIYPKGEVFSAYLVAGKQLNFDNPYFSFYRYESLKSNVYLISDKVNQSIIYSLYVSDYERSPIVVVVRWILWILAIMLIIGIPIFIALSQGQSSEAVKVALALIVIIPFITIIIDRIIAWMFL